MHNPTMDWICLDDEDQSSQKISQSQPEYDFTPWPHHEQQAFECAVSELDLDSPNFIRDLSSKIHWRSMNEVKMNFAALIDEISKIEVGHFDVLESEFGLSDSVDDLQMNDQGGGVNENRHKCSSGDRTSENAVEVTNVGGTPVAGGTAEGEPSTRARKKRAVPVQRRRGVPWTKEQHRLFLMGMKRYGRGNWRSISRHFVLSKTPTQVASHAQKYFRRLESTTPVERRRPSIHDIQTISCTDISTTPFFGTMYNFYQQNHGTLQSTAVTQPMIIPPPPSTMYNYQHPVVLQSAGTSSYDIPSISRTTAFSMAPLAQSLPIPPPPTTMYNYQAQMAALQSRPPNDVSGTPTTFPPPPTSMYNNQNLNVNTINLGNNHAFDQPSTSSVSPMSFSTMMMNQPLTSDRPSYMFSFPEKQPWF